MYHQHSWKKRTQLANVIKLFQLLNDYQSASKSTGISESDVKNHFPFYKYNTIIHKKHTIKNIT